MNLAGTDVLVRARGSFAPAMPTHRFDNITQSFTNVVRCVDDSLLWEDDLNSKFDLTCKYISTCSRGGINFNNKKFRYAQDKVKYVGFKLNKDSIIPADSMSESIRNVPAPWNITEAKAFLGLVEQFSFALSKCADKVAFRHLLSPKVRFLWN